MTGGGDTRGAAKRSRVPPPAGPPWDLPLEEAPLAFVDLEMTGLEPARDRIVEVCVERVRGGEVEERLHTLVLPEDGTCGNVHVHGLGPDELAGAPAYASLAPRVAELLEGAVLVAHGAPWDVAFLEAEARRAGGALEIAHYIDTLHLSRRTFDLAHHSLDALRAHFELASERAHRADADVATLRAVWQRCVSALEPKTPRDLWEVRVAERRAREQILAECAEAHAHGRPVTLVYRPRARPAAPIRMVVTEIDASSEPPRVRGYEVPGRGRRDLRADRILRVEEEPR